MTTTPDRLALKVRRTVWVEADHPRDRKGRFIEKGATVRVWGGWLGKVVGLVGGGRIEVERVTDGKHILVHRNYLTVETRPDGSEPTDKRDANPADLREQAATAGAETMADPDTAPDVDAPAQSANLYDLLLNHGERERADLIRQAARDYQAALGNGIPDDEADERDGLLAVLDEIEAGFDPGTEDADSFAQAVTSLRDAAEAEPAAPGREFQPFSERFTAGGARQVATAVDEYDGDAGVRVSGEQVTVEDPDAAGPFIDQALTVSDAIASNEAIPEVMRSTFELRSTALRRLQSSIADRVTPDAKPVYSEGNEEERDEPTGGDGGAALPGAPADGVRGDSGEGPDGVLRDAGDAGAGADRLPGTGPAGTRPRVGDVPGADEPVRVREGDGGIDGGPGVPAADAGADTGDRAEPGAGGVRGGADGVREPAGQPVRDAGRSADGVTLTQGDVVYWRNPDPDAFVTTRRGVFSHYGNITHDIYGGNPTQTAYFDYQRELSRVERDRGVRTPPAQRMRADVADLFPENPDAPSAAEVEWRTRNEDGYVPPAAAEEETVTLTQEEIDSALTSLRPDFEAIEEAEQASIDAEREAERERRRVADNIELYGQPEIPDDDQLAAEADAELSDEEANAILDRLNALTEDQITGAEGADLIRDALRGDAAEEPDASSLDDDDDERIAFEEQRAAEEAFAGLADHEAEFARAAGITAADWASMDADQRDEFIEDAAAANAEAAAPALPTDFADVEPGTRLRFGYGDTAHDGTVTSVYGGRWGGNPQVNYRRDDTGEDANFTPGTGEQPRPAEGMTIERDLRAMRRRRNTTLDPESGLPMAGLNVHVGTWRTAFDEDDDGIVTITGANGIQGEMRPTTKGWIGFINGRDYGSPTFGDPENITAGPDPDPQAVLDALFNGVNGPGHTERSRDEVAAGRAPAPEVGARWDRTARGTRISLPVSERDENGAYTYAPGTPRTVLFDTAYQQTWRDDSGWVYFYENEADMASPDVERSSLYLTADQFPKRPVPGDPALGAEDAVTLDTDADATDNVTYEPDPYAVPVLDADSPRFAPGGLDDFAPAGTMAKIDANLAVLRTLRTLRTENRAATPEEQATLARWASWGGAADVFDESKPQFEARRNELKDLLDPTEYARARRTTINAHYTDPRVVEQVWRAMGDLGMSGRVLEPGSGSGTFIGYRPEGVDMVGVELDSTTAAISKYLYPDATIRNESFAATAVPDGAFDGAIGNVPFGKFALNDPTYNPTGESIHNHFILKSLKMTRPGGIVAVMSSRYTLDSKSDAARRLMFEQADLVGAVRFPNGSHQRIAGTDVIEDLLIFRKRADGEEPGDDTWVTASQAALDGWDVTVNDYFTANPDKVLGDLGAAKGRYGGEVRVTGDKDTPDLAGVLDGIVADAREKGLTATDRPADKPLPQLLTATSGRYAGHMQREEDGTFTIAEGGASVPFNVPPKQREELTALLGIRDTLLSLLDAETASAEDNEQITGLRASLNQQYDAYVAQYGPISRFTYTKSGARKRAPLGGFRNDPKAAVITALEKYTPPDRTVPGDVGSATKEAIFTTRAVAPRVLAETADNPDDALTLSMDRFGFVNLPAIADMLGTSEDEARAQLGARVFEDPPLTEEEQQVAHDAARALAENGGGHLGDLEIGADSLREPGRLVPAAEYLSGNVRRKLAAARAAAEVDPRYAANVEALRGVIPRDLGQDEITPSLGASWIPPQVIEEFANSLLRVPSWEKKRVKVYHSGGGIWKVEGARVGSQSAAFEEWGTHEKPFHSLLGSLLEQRPISVTVKGKKDLDATLAAQAKAEEISERFAEWLWEDPERARRMAARYNEQYNALALRSYDGQGRSFPGMSEDWQAKVQPHVKNAVERIINEPTAMLAHVVGAGKTAEMVMGTQELKRLGLARKPAIVVPNHMLDQMTREYLEIYPSAKILTAGQGMSAEERRTFVARAATGDWDAVILTQGAFKGIPMSPRNMEAYIDRELADQRAQLEIARADAEGNKAAIRTVKAMETALIRAEAALRKKLEKVKDLGVSWEQTGIDYLMIDEAHEYSNLRTLSAIQGAGTTGSDMATDLHMKLEYIRENSRTGRVATFATGTPIRNTITQAYVMTRYLRPDLMKEAGIHSFDQWAATFGKVVDTMELKPEGKGFRNAQRFAEFRNVPEFLRMFHTYADVKMAEDLNLPRPNLAGGRAQIVSVPASNDLKAYVNDLGDRAELVRAGRVQPEEDNMLKISTDGRKAALSMALVTDESGRYYDHEPGKIEAAAENIAKIWADTADQQYGDDERTGAFQIVFMDLGTPKGDDDKRDKDDDSAGDVDTNDSDFVAYDHLKSLLVENYDIPADQVRYIHEAKTDEQKAEMFAAARDGRIRVLLGSSQKMGVGTNMQRRAKALHHIDAPWRPADVEQRDGRAHRQGNLHRDLGQDIAIYRYVTEGSFDAYMWQTLERKAKFINQVMRGTLDVREIEDIGDTALSYAEVKAIATGNPDFLELATGETLVTKLQRLSRGHARTQTNMRHEIARQTERAELFEAEAVQLGALTEQTVIPTDDTGKPVFRLGVDGVEHDDRLTAGAALLTKLEDIRTSSGFGRQAPKVVGTYKGHTVLAATAVDPNGSGRYVALSLEGSDYEFGRLMAANLRPGQGTALGVVQRIDKFIDSLDHRANYALTTAAESRGEVANMEARVGTTFAREHELAAWTAKVERLRAKIARDEKREGGGGPDFDPRIDTDRYDDPITKGGHGPDGSASATETYVPLPPPAEQPASLEINAGDVAIGDSVEFILSEVSGTTSAGKVVAKKEAGSFVFLTIEVDGTEYVRAFDATTPVTKVATADSLTGVKGSMIVRTLQVKDGRVVLTAEVKRRSVWREELHPRDRNGRFIETFAEVRIWGGGKGRVTGIAGGGRVKVRRDDGIEVVVDSGNVEVIASAPDNIAPATPQAPEDVEDARDAAARAGTPVPEVPRPTDDDHEVVRNTPRQSTAGGPPVPQSPEDVADARDAAARAGTPVPPVPQPTDTEHEVVRSAGEDADTTPAPEANPQGAAAVFTAQSGARAWLDTSSGEPVGYVQTDPDDSSTIRRYNDAAAWAEDVDAEGMTEDSDGGSAESQRQMAADDTAAASGPAAMSDEDLMKAYLDIMDVPANVRDAEDQAIIEEQGRRTEQRRAANTPSMGGGAAAPSPGNNFNGNGAPADDRFAQPVGEPAGAPGATGETDLGNVEEPALPDTPTLVDGGIDLNGDGKPDDLVSASDRDLASALNTVPPADVVDVIKGELTNRAARRAARILRQAEADEPAVTTALTSIAAKFGGKMEGLDNRLKTMESLTDKIRNKALLRGQSQDQAAGNISDALRYTMTLDHENYSQGVQEAFDAFEAAGYTRVEADNTWGKGQVYQGINSVFMTEDGVKFEVQFHTPESFVAKTKTHKDYNISRDPLVPLPERQAAHDRMVALQESNPIPVGVETVGDIKAGVQRPKPQSPEEYRQIAVAEMKVTAAELEAIDLSSARPVETVDLNMVLPDGVVADFEKYGGGSAMPHLIDTPEGKRFSPERQELHQRIIAHILDGFESEENPRFHVLGGGPAAGKSTIVDSMPHISEGNALINPDEIKAMFPEYLAGVENKDGGASSHVHEESSHLAKMVQAEAFGRKVSVTLDGTGDSSASKMIGKIEDAKAAGYAVNGFYVTVDTDEAWRRANLRAEKTGRAVPEFVVRNTHIAVSSIFEQIAPSFDSLVLMDTQQGGDGEAGMVMLKEPGGNVKIIDPDLYAKFLGKAQETPMEENW